jgi:uncharacterized phage protein (TIGR02216 family)
MTERFSDSAARLAGQAGVLFHWRPEEFWRATPAELASLFRALAPEAGGLGRRELADLMERFPDDR